MLLVISALAVALSSPAQTAPITPKQQRAANRQALRDARHAEVPYKESHLTVTPEQLKRGSTAGPPGVANQPRLRRDGSPRPGKAVRLSRRIPEPTL